MIRIGSFSFLSVQTPNNVTIYKIRLLLKSNLMLELIDTLSCLTSFIVSASLKKSSMLIELGLSCFTAISTFRFSTPLCTLPKLPKIYCEQIAG